MINVVSYSVFATCGFNTAAMAYAAAAANAAG
jgi:hypothetical protein